MSDPIMYPSMTPQIQGDLLSKVNLFRWIREFARASKIDRGYYMEFGVLNGEGIVTAYRQLRGILSHVYGFDSFEGLPQLDQRDKSGLDLMPVFHQGNYRSMSEERVSETIRQYCRIPREDLTLVGGFFSESLPGFDKTFLEDKGFPIAMYVDCDLYSSSAQVFDFLTDIVQTGTWILLDDYWCYRGHPSYGQRRAFEEWIRNNGRVGVSAYGNFAGFGRAYLAYEL